MRSSKAELRADFVRIVASAKRNRIVFNKYGENRISLYSPLPPDEVDYGPLEETFLYAKLKYNIDVEVAGGGFGCLNVVLNAEVSGCDTGEQLDLFLRDEITRANLNAAGVTYASFVSKHLSGEFESFSEFVFYYGTNRARGNSQNVRKFYGDKEALILETGLVHVHVNDVPPGHIHVNGVPPRLVDLKGVPPRKKKPSMISRVWREVQRGLFERSEEKSAKINGILPLLEEETWQRFKKDSEGRQPLFFVHGFNTPFADCLENFALLLSKLNVYQTCPSILPVIYAWPGSPRPNLRKYPAANILGKRASHFMLRMLEQLIEHAAGSAPNLMAHSHGAQVLISTLRLRRETWGKGGKVNGDKENIFNELILVAPDVDAGEYKQFHKEILNMVRRISIYFNQKDGPLKKSGSLRKSGPRLGVCPSGLGGRGTDLIDTEKVSISGNKHSYHMDANEVIYDLNELLDSKPAAGRGPWIKVQDGADPNSGNWVLCKPGES